MNNGEIQIDGPKDKDMEDNEQSFTPDRTHTHTQICGKKDEGKRVISIEDCTIYIYVQYTKQSKERLITTANKSNINKNILRKINKTIKSTKQK